MRRIIKLGCIVLIIVFGSMMSGCEKSGGADFQEVVLEELDEEGTSGEEKIVSDNAGDREKKMYIHVCGEVETPGVYELNAGSRIFEAIEAAGGMTKTAAENSINQAEFLVDGQQVYIPSEEEVRNQNNETMMMDTGKMNINEASKEELMTLSGIGESKADAIIRYREANGNFKSIEEIMEIEGIKEGVFRKIEDQITVS